MNDIRGLSQQLRDAGLVVSEDLATAPGAASWLDVAYGGRSVAVAWHPGQGFGVSLLPEREPLEGLFEGPDELYGDAGAAKVRVLELLDFDEAPAFHPKVATG